MIKGGEIHVPKECTVLAIIPLNCQNKSQVIISWPSCSKSNHDVVYKDLKRLGETIISMTGQPLISYCTDSPVKLRE